MRPGNPLENQLQDIAFGAVFGEGHYRSYFGPEKAACPQCGRKVKAVGLEQHTKDKHGDRDWVGKVTR